MTVSVLQSSPTTTAFASSSIVVTLHMTDPARVLLLIPMQLLIIAYNVTPHDMQDLIVHAGCDWVVLRTCGMHG